MSRYLKLINETTPYAMRMSRLRNRIFGDSVRQSDEKSIKVVNIFQEKPFYMDENVVNYYPRMMETFHLMANLRKYGLYRDEHHDFQVEISRLRRLRGKVKPKKGCGKQAVNK